LQPLRRRTWALRGQTPVQRCWDRYDRLSVLGAITVSPKRRRLDLRFRVWHENIRTWHVVRFLKQLRQELRRPLVVVLDRLPAHRSAAKQLRQEGYRDIHFEWLPAYAPDLNPVETLWSYTKYSDLANFLPEDQHELRRSVCRSIETQRRRKQLLRSFFHAAQLRL
jgi:transposase